MKKLLLAVSLCAVFGSFAARTAVEVRKKNISRFERITKNLKSSRKKQVPFEEEVYFYGQGGMVIRDSKCEFRNFIPSFSKRKNYLANKPYVNLVTVSLKPIEAKYFYFDRVSGKREQLGKTKIGSSARLAGRIVFNIINAHTA